MEKIRIPAVAGAFYPRDKEGLLRAVDNCFTDPPSQVREALIVVMPHAGYVYSGNVCGEVLSLVNVPNRIILLGPKHHHGGANCAVSQVGAWRFPFGDVPIDKPLAARIVEETNAMYDDTAHADEHSLEVQVPFLWRRNQDVTITPVALGRHRIDEIEAFAAGLVRAVQKIDDPVLIVASTDMSHYVSAIEAAQLDKMAIDRMLALNPRGLFHTVVDNHISMCGFIPTTAAIFAATALGAKNTTLVRYTNSAEVSGDVNQVVSYAGLIIS